MNEPVMTLFQLFRADPQQDGGADALEQAEPLKNLDEKLDAQPGEVKVGHASTLVMGSLEQAMDVPIVQEILIKVWNEGGLFQKYLDPDAYPAEETIEVTLVKHGIASIHHPYVEIRLGEASAQRINFEVTLALQLHGAVVELKGGKILKVRMGACFAAGEVKVEGFRVFARQSSPVKLPGEVSFEDGITIAA